MEAGKARASAGAVAGLAFMALLVLLALTAPLLADALGTDPWQTHLSDSVVRSGESVEVVSSGGIPIGPAFSFDFPLGADASGRDVLVRVAYGAREVLTVGLGSAALALILGVLAGLSAASGGRFTDRSVRWILDLLWSFPVIVLAMALGVALASGGISAGPVEIGPGSRLVSILIIGFVLTPYVARPLRARGSTIRGSDYVTVARLAGASRATLIFREFLPNLRSTSFDLLPALIAGAILLDASLAYLGVGTTPNSATWGALIRDGTEMTSSAPHLALVPGLALTGTVLALNAIGTRISQGRPGRFTIDPPLPGAMSRKP